MVCRRCGNSFNTQENRQRDGSTKCPSCGAVYRPRQQTAKPNGQHKNQASRNAQQPRKHSKRIDWKALATKKIWKLPVWAWIIIVLVALIYPSSAPVKNDENQPEVLQDVIATTEPTTIQTTEPTATVEPILTVSDFETIWDYAADKAFNSNYGGTKFELLAQDTSEPRVRFKVSSKMGFYVDVCDFCQSAAKAEGYENVEYDAIRFWGWMETADIYGNIGEDNVFRITIPKETLDEINWDNFAYENILKVGTDYWEDENVVY